MCKDCMIESIRQLTLELHIRAYEEDLISTFPNLEARVIYMREQRNGSELKCPVSTLINIDIKQNYFVVIKYAYFKLKCIVYLVTVNNSQEVYTEYTLP